MITRDYVIELANESEATYGQHKWNWVSIELGKRYSIVKTPEACRSEYRRYEEETKEYNVDVKPTIAQNDPVKNRIKEGLISREIKENGTQVSERRIMMSETDSKNPEFVMKAHGYDPLEWEIVNVYSNFWDSNSVERGIETLYQSKLIVRPRTAKSNLSQADIMALVELINSGNLKHDFKLVEVVRDGKLALEVDFADLHIGSFSWWEEVGENNDYKIAFGNLKRVVAQIRAELETGKYEKLYLVNLGDFVHADTKKGETSNGTVLDVDSRPIKMIMKSVEMIMYIIDNLCVIPTELISVLGNHSVMVEFTIFYCMTFIYRSCEHISFNIAIKPRTAFLYGKNLVGLLHGNDIGKLEQDTWLQDEYREWWAQCEYAEIHCGHWHKEMATNERGGITKRTNPALKVIDKHEYDHGWKSKKAVLGYVWHKDDHLLNVFYFK